MKIHVQLILLIQCIQSVFGNIRESNSFSKENDLVRVNKCCEPYELLLGKSCVHFNNTNEKIWQPMFTSERGEANIKVSYRLVPGTPDCGSRQTFPIYFNANSTEKLQLLPNGVLRHIYSHPIPNEDEDIGIEILDGKDLLFHDFPQGQYCMDKRIDGNVVSEFAKVCVPEHENSWTRTEFVMHNIVSPVTHGINIACLLTIAVIYFVMPNLRDLVGNIITTMCFCLILSQIGGLLRMLTVFTSHISLLITETICYIFLLGSFFWLNSLAFYIWRTFKSRNVFLRITDKKKYCYYSMYSWSCTIILGVLAIFAHFTMDYPEFNRSIKFFEEREEIGSLGLIIFFVPIAFVVILDIYFFASTMKVINRMHTYGRIHHKLRHSFRMFLLLLVIKTITWLFFLASFTKYESLVNTYLIVNAFQGPLILYVCIFNQKHVLYLVQKTCCYNTKICSCCRPKTELEWGDEMTAMNTGLNY
ncbi:probable G-protein coupled receptor Mth-like 5 [Harmonia axyridis]|uniref:probable G-protein coupled receptor Mth-like 5 n=1 Tax=Harmonia axyridis TaxID=115357 RepID=UPI001E275D1B|nr:probable G-protein coupled receptor Mth-like 5 [Harmonia axyridis]